MRLRRPRRPPWRKLFTLLQWVLFLLVGIYMDLFFEIHKLSITSDHHSRENRIVAVPNFPKLKQQQKKKNATTTTILPSSTRINTHYNEYGYNYTNRIVEGKLAVEYYLQSHKPLWEHSQTLPQWMKQYFEWHQHTHKWLLEHPDEWNTTNLNYYVVECSEFWNKCGGTADRLSPLPLHIKVASDTQRLLLIYWTKPAPLEEFLLPPIGGVDWRMPEWLVKHFWVDENYYPAPFEKRMIRNSRRKNLRWVRVKYQSHNHGSEYYNSQRSKQEPTFDAVVHDLWRVFFTPHSNIAQQIETQMHLSQLSPGRYVAAHLRALYQVQERDPAIVQWWATNAVNCVTSKLSSYNSGGPILFVSDTTLATETAAEYGRQHSLKVVHRSHKTLPLHLEKANVTTDDLTLYYDTFVDLYMMGMSQCVAYHMGGYGILGVRISYNSSCFHHMLAQMEPCNLEIQTTTTITSNNNNNNMEWESPLFLPPMRMLADPNNNSYLATANNNHNHMIQTNTTTKTKTTTIDENTTTATTTTTTMQKSQRKRGQKADDPDITKSEKGIVSTTTTTTKTRYRSKSYNYTEITLQDPMLYQTFQASSSPEGETTTNLWRHSKTIPSWMKKYFRWHQSQRQKYVNPEHWNASPSNIKYLIMECLEHQPKCGGTSDRLKPLPTLVRIAAYTNRLLLIHWNRPAMLEEFLLPPKGGVDWRVPEWMHPLVTDWGGSATLVDEVRYYALGGNQSLRTKYQSYDGGRGFYDSALQNKETPFDNLYHDVWNVFFTPAYPVAKAIKSEMDAKGLIPGDYASAHNRVLYALTSRPKGIIKGWTVNALNCASNLRPGKPIFLASDSKDAVEIGLKYGEFRNAKIVSHESNPNPPLHLDKAANTTNNGLPQHPPSDYYDTFIDLYLLAFGRCVFINKGGYGSWALLIGGDIQCVYKQKRSKRGIQNPCEWMDLNGTKTVQAQLTKPLFLEPMDSL